MWCPDLGCCGGEVTLETAKRVAPDGMASGVDMDEVKLGLAKTGATERGDQSIQRSLAVYPPPTPARWRYHH